jgi:hypothetical protein
VPATATIYDLDGRILRDAGPLAARSARAIARRLACAVVVEDWTNCRRYRVTRTGLIRRPPPHWMPASAMVPDPPLRAMRRDPVRYARELELHRLDLLARAKSRAWYRAWQRRQARLKRDAPLAEARLTATIAADKAKATLESMAR